MTFAVGAAAEVLALLVVGAAVDRVGRHNCVSLGQLLSGAACLACAMVQGGATQAALRLLASLAAQVPTGGLRHTLAWLVEAASAKLPPENMQMCCTSARVCFGAASSMCLRRPDHDVLGLNPLQDVRSPRALGGSTHSAWFKRRKDRPSAVSRHVGYSRGGCSVTGALCWWLWCGHAAVVMAAGLQLPPATAPSAKRETSLVVRHASLTAGLLVTRCRSALSHARHHSPACLQQGPIHVRFLLTAPGAEQLDTLQ
jgi:hypothetical protein